MKKHPKPKIVGAGFVIISNDLKKVLLLKNKGVVDLPKGSTIGDETHIETARRECLEETGITVSDDSIVDTKPYICENLAFFVAVQNGKPVISPNPVTGETEHDWCGWVRWHIAIREAPIYLRPALLHARALTNVLVGGKDVDIP
jgi:8-oxo-dGTP pyrophosphatase MutT (NUDIX family)